MARKISGGRYKKRKKKKKAHRRGISRIVKIGKEKKKKLRIRGGKFKEVLLGAQKIHVLNPKTRKTSVVNIKKVLEVPSNKFLARSNVIVKGAIVETPLGKVKITNRPSQEGQVQGVLIY